MRHEGRESWAIRISRWESEFDCALWIRAIERIDVLAGGIVPGPLTIDPLPDPSAAASGSELAGERIDWWRTVCGLSPVGRRVFDPPDFARFGRWPNLRAVFAPRWADAVRWHNERKQAGLDEFGPSSRRQEREVVAEVEKSLGRPSQPFELEFIVLPVQDREIRPVTTTRFLVPEQVYDSRDWTAWLRRQIPRFA